MSKILVVEDMPIVRHTFTRTLSSLGHWVLEADSAIHALRVVEADPKIELVFADVVMPGKSGCWLIRQIAARFPHVRTCLVSGWFNVIDGKRDVLADDLLRERECLESMPLLMKPFKRGELEDMITKVLAAKPWVWVPLDSTRDEHRRKGDKP